MGLLSIIKDMRDNASTVEEMKEVFRYIFTVYPSTVPVDVCAAMADVSSKILIEMIEKGDFPGTIIESDDGKRNRYIVFTGKWLDAIGMKETLFERTV